MVDNSQSGMMTRLEKGDAMFEGTWKASTAPRGAGPAGISADYRSPPVT
jgi:hypothetical protein